MKEIKAMDKVYLHKYGIEVKPYLTVSEIQAIVNGVNSLKSWGERQISIDLCTLMFATNIEREKLEEIGHDTLLQSGLIDAVKAEIINLYDIQEALNYTESISRALTQVLSVMPKAVEKNGSNNHKRKSVKSDV